jgi:hypothetical protein
MTNFEYEAMVRKMFSMDDDMSTTSTGAIGVGAVRTAAMDEARIRDARARLDKTVLPDVSFEAGEALGLRDLEQAKVSERHDGELSKSTNTLDKAAHRTDSTGWGEGWGSDVTPTAPLTKFARSDLEPKAPQHPDGIQKETDSLGRWEHVWKAGVYQAGRCDADDGSTMFFDQNGNEVDAAVVQNCFVAA